MHGRARIVPVLLVTLALGACPAPRRPAPPEGPPPSMPAAVPTFPGATAHQVVAGESLVRILAFRGGTLSGAGHNHLVSARHVSGTVWLHDEPARSGFRLVLPVTQLEVDDQQLRNEEGGDFAREVPLQARQGTRQNMLGAALLDAERYPEITLTSLEVAGSFDALQVRTRVDIKGQAREMTIPVSVLRESGRLTATGELTVKQTDLGLTPFTVMLGALQVQDEIIIRFRIVAQR